MGHAPWVGRSSTGIRVGSQRPAAVSARGRADGSIWQYNREWVRDQAFVALALTELGHHALAATMLRRLLTEFVTDEGATLDSSAVRSRDDVELDQNGVLLHVLERYVVWTGDGGLVTSLWDRIAARAVEVGIATDAVFGVIIMVILLVQINKSLHTLDVTELKSLKG